jgi:DNA-binding protein HU-beta
MAAKPAMKAKTPAKKAAATKTASKAAAAPAKKAAPPKKAAVAKAPRPVATLALKAVFADVAADQSLSKKQADALLAGMVTAVTTHLKNGDRVRMAGLGILEVRNREARMGRNPATGEAIQIAASKKVAFRVAKELKEAV